MKTFKWAAVYLLSFGLACSAVAARPYRVEIVPWDPAVKFPWFESPGVITDAGIVTGDELDAGYGPERGFIYYGGVVHDLAPVLGGDGDSGAGGVNNRLQASGCSWWPSGSFPYECACVWQNGIAQFLPLPSGAVGSYGGSINNLGVVAGSTYYPDGSERAAIFRSNWVSEIPGLSANWSYATQINDRCQVIGVTADSTGADRAFFWNGKVMKDLGTLGGRGADAYAMSGGIVVGAADTAQATVHPFAFTGSHMIDLGLLPGYAAGSANSINSRGEIVGFCGDWISSSGFYCYHGRMVDLNDLAGNSDGNRLGGWITMPHASTITAKSSCKSIPAELRS